MMLSLRSIKTKAFTAVLACLTLLPHSVASPSILNKRGIGSMTVSENCPYPVWVQFVYQKAGNPPWLPMTGNNALGIFFSFDQNPPLSPTDADGISIKLGLQDYTGQSPGPITQVEIAWNETAGTVAYDVSDLDADGGPSPFWKEGYVLWSDTAASSEWPTCNLVHCAANEDPCTDVYWSGEPVDSHGESIINHIHTCPDTANVFFEACTG